MVRKLKSPRSQANLLAIRSRFFCISSVILVRSWNPKPFGILRCSFFPREIELYSVWHFGWWDWTSWIIGYWMVFISMAQDLYWLFLILPSFFFCLFQQPLRLDIKVWSIVLATVFLTFLSVYRCGDDLLLLLFPSEKICSTIRES